MFGFSFFAVATVAVGVVVVVVRIRGPVVARSVSTIAVSAVSAIAAVAVVREEAEPSESSEIPEPATVAPLTGEVMATAGRVESLLTVTATAGETLVLPAKSRTTADRVWAPLVPDDVFQATLYGASVSAAPKFVPSSTNWTLATPTLSLAVAATETEPDTDVPVAGWEIVKLPKPPL